ncbi:tetratricopeptide repeat protein, partial [Streptomyces massasporeus]
NGIAARQIGELDKARTTLTSVVSLYQEAHQDPGAALALCSLGITLHHQGRLTDAAARLREALALQPRAPARGRRRTARAEPNCTESPPVTTSATGPKR